jgi:hypothetical protein
MVKVDVVIVYSREYEGDNEVIAIQDAVSNKDLEYISKEFNGIDPIMNVKVTQEDVLVGGGMVVAPEEFVK